MSFGVTVGCSLTAKIPSFHDTLVTLTFGDSLHVDVLANLKVSWTQHVTDGQEAFWSDRELGEVLLWWQSVSQEVSSMGLLKLSNINFAAPNLYGIIPVGLFCFNLNDLAPVNL